MMTPENAADALGHPAPASAGSQQPLFVQSELPGIQRGFQHDVGVLLVHGIGDHKEGDTLVAFGEPLIDWLREWLRGSGGTDARGSVRVTAANLRAVRTEAVSPAYAQVEVSMAGGTESERWVVAEAWWGDSVQPPGSLRLMGWLLSRGPLLLFWHFYRERFRQAYITSGWTQLQGLLAIVLAGSVQLVVLVAMLLWLVPFGSWRRAVSNAVRAVTLTLGDSYVMLEQDFQRAALVRRVERSLEWLAARAARLVVVAHSQGGAIAHEALRRMRTNQVAGFVSIGSGLEKLLFLRQVRDQRSGVLSASLVAPLMVVAAVLAVSGVRGGADLRWVVGLGVVVVFGALAAGVFVIEALESYQKQLLPHTAELDLGPALGPVEWHDLRATHDLVPMGKGSLLEGAAFVARHEVANQRSYLNDHVGYFENRLGCLSLLWPVLAHYSRLPLFDLEAGEKLARAAQLHRRRTWFLWLGGLGAWTGAAAGLFAMRAYLSEVGAALRTSLDGLGLGWLAKVVQTAGWVIAGALSGLSNASLQLDQNYAGLALLTCLALVLSAAIWWAVFKAVWLLRTEACWRKACRQSSWLDARGWTAGDIACSLMWVNFALVPLAIALPLVFMPGELILDRIGLGTGIALAAGGILVAMVYAIGGVWIFGLLERHATTLPVSIGSPIGVFIAMFPIGLFIVIWFGLAWASWLWPDAVGPTKFAALRLAVWVLLSVSTILWLLTRGWRMYGLPATACVLSLALAAGVLLARGWVVDGDLAGRVIAFDAFVLGMMSLAVAIRERGQFAAMLQHHLLPTRRLLRWLSRRKNER